METKIGEGSYGMVFVRGGAVVKKTDVLHICETDVGTYIYHPHILSFSSVKLVDNLVEISYPFNKCDFLKIPLQGRYIKQLLCALISLNKAGILHVDIKPGNLLYSVEKELLLADLGGCYYHDDGVIYSKGNRTTPMFAAPECLKVNKGKKHIYLAVSQVWSIGMCILNTFMGDKFFAWILSWLGEKNINNEKKMKKFLDTSHNKLLSLVRYLPGDEMKDFVSKCLTYKWQDRPSLSALLKHPLLLSLCKEGEGEGEGKERAEVKIPLTVKILYPPHTPYYPRKGLFKDISAVSLAKKKIRYVTLCAIIHTALCNPTIAMIDVIGMIDMMMEGIHPDVDKKFPIMGYLPGNSLFYCCRNLQHFNEVILDIYLGYTNSYSALVPIDKPYRPVFMSLNMQ